MRTRLTSSLFLLTFFLFALTLVAQDNGLFQAWNSKATSSQTNHVLEHYVTPLDTVRIGIIGLGNRGQMALERLPKIVGVQIKAISEILPVLKSPTVLPLAQEGWSSIHSVINAGDFWEVIDQLKAAGAEDILVCPIEKMVR